jgi:eukaryotic-like serine/threonine-protein kinase
VSASESHPTERSAGPLEAARAAAVITSRPDASEDDVERPPLAGRYRLKEILGRGGVGIVRRAEDLVTGTEVAIKELRLPDDLSSTERESLLERTAHEARLASRLHHHNVVHVHEVVNEDERPWIVMELLEAESLAKIISISDERLPARHVAEIGLQLISALTAAHEEGIVHRDVKPDNVMIDKGGRVVLTDFGLAVWAGTPTLTASGRIVGSPAYIPPERARAGTVGPASDLWSLGATLYTAVEGHPPYDRKGYLAILRGDELSDPPPAQNAGPLGPVLEGLLHVAPENRLTTANATKMLRIAALAPSGVSTNGAGSTTARDDPTQPLPAPQHASDPPPVSSGPRHRSDQPRFGAHLSHALQESLHESVASLSGTVSSAFYRGSHARKNEALSELLASVRESTDKLGLTRTTTTTGRHRGDQSAGPRAGVVTAVAVGVIILLTVVLWALVTG